MREFEHFPNLVTMFFTRAKEQGDAPFLWAKKGGSWQSISWAETAQQVASFAQSLKDIGLEGHNVQVAHVREREFQTGFRLGNRIT